VQQVVPIPKPKTKESTTKQSTSSPVTKNESTFGDASENPLLALHERIGNKAMASLLQQKAKQKTNQKKEAEQKSKPEEKGDEKKSKEKTKDKGLLEKESKAEKESKEKTKKDIKNKHKEITQDKSKNKQGKKSKAKQTEKSAAQTPKLVGTAPALKQPASKKEAESKESLAGNSSEAMLENFTNLSPTGVAQNYPSLGTKISEKFQDDRKNMQEKTPKFQAKSKKQAKPASEQKLSADVVKSPTVITQKPTQINIPHSEGPKIELTGEADPNKSSATLQESSQKVQAKQAEESQKILANNSENKIKPLPMEEEAQAQIAQAGSKTATKQDDKMAEYAAATEIPLDIKNNKDFTNILKNTQTTSQNKVKDAAKKRDKEQELAEQDTQNKAEDLSTNASLEQQQAIDDSKNQILQEKEKGIQETKKKLTDFDKNASQQHQDTLQKINTKVKTEQQKANKAVEEGSKKAKQKHEEAKRHAAEKEKEMRAKKKKRKWWQKIGDFFKGLAKAIAGVVTKIFDAVKKVVNAVLDAAKKLATGIIDLARKAVVGLLKAYAAVLKGVVNTLLASFPALRKKINAAIDGVVKMAVTIVNKVADKLKSAVTALIDKFQKAVNFLINAYESLVTGAIQMMGALLSGDFAGALKIAFLAVCKAAGLPGEELLSMLSRAGSLLINIIKNPVPFIKNLIGAAKKGFTQFAKNFGKHLKAGLMGWLFGQVAATGIKLPSSFSVAGIFDVVRQVLGLTYEYVRERAVAKIGEENVERIEKVASYLKILFTGGPAKLWEQIKGDLSNLKQTLMDGIVDFIVQKIVQSAVTKIASMLIPGAGFVQAIISTYNTIQFFVSKIKEILAVVNSVLDSISKIAKGDIASAANYIEGTLAKTIPLVIGFMAKLIGIGGIGEKIRKIIDKLRTPVNKAVDFVIDKAISLFKKITGQGKEEGKTESKSKMDGAVDKVLAEPPAPKNRNAEQKKDDLQYAYKIAEKIIAKSKDTEEIEDYFPKMIKRFGLVDIHMMNLGKPSAKLHIKINPEATIVMHNNQLTLASGDENGVEFIHPSVTFKKASLGGDTVGIEMKAKGLDADHPKGTTPNGLDTVMGWLQTDSSGGSAADAYVRGHLLNHDLGGPGVAQNLFPITGQANIDHKNVVENTIKVWVNEKRWVIDYSVEIRSGYKSNFALGKKHNYVNSVIDIHAGVWGVNGNYVDEYTKVIESTKSVKPTRDTPMDVDVDETEAVKSKYKGPIEGHGGKASKWAKETAKKEEEYIIK